MTDVNAELARDARRRSRAFAAAVLDSTLDQGTIDRLGDELMVEHQFEGLRSLAGIAMLLLRDLSTQDPLSAYQRLTARHPDAETCARTDELIAAYCEDPTGWSERLREAVMEAGSQRGRDAVRDLGLVAAGAAKAVGGVRGMSGLQVIEQLAVHDEQR